MKIVANYSFNGGKEAVLETYKDLYDEIEDCIAQIDPDSHRIKISREKTMLDKMLFSPVSLNRAFKRVLTPDRGWATHRVKCDYPTEHYMDGYSPKALRRGAFREMDFVKRRLGVEVQFGKYAFMVYNVCAKMTIFHNLDLIDIGIEIVPVKGFSDEMSTGVSYFEQFVWDLNHRGVSDIDIPVLILGIDS